MNKKTKSLVLKSPRNLEIQEFELPKIGSKDLLMKVEMVGCGGAVDRYTGMSIWSPPYPLIMGHEVVGYVQEIGNEAANIYKVNLGDRICVEPYFSCLYCKYCRNGYYHLCPDRKVYGTSISCKEPPHLWGGFGEHLFVAPGSKVHKMPKEVPAKAACLSSVIGNGVRHVKINAKVKFKESVIIAGAGSQGLACVVAAAESGAKPIIVLSLTKDKKGRELAKEFGAHFLVDVDKCNPLKAVAEITNGNMGDVFIECTGNPEMEALGVDLLAPRGRFIMVGMPTGEKMTFLPISKLVRKEITIHGSLGQAGGVEDAIKIINSGKYNIDKMITHTFPLEKGKEALEFFSNPSSECIKVALIP